MKRHSPEPSPDQVSPPAISRWDATRRAFLKASSVAVAGSLFRKTSVTASRGATGPVVWPKDAVLNAVEELPLDRTRTWLGSSFWSNRLQDWQLADGWIECLNGSARLGLRTAAVLN